MNNVLNSVSWGKNVINLVKNSKNLDPERPAVMHIRHSERPQMDVEKEAFKMALTPRGEKASHEFGKMLPVDRIYYFYHTDMERTVQTAEMMKKGIQENGGVAEIVDEIPLFSVLNYDKAAKIIREMSINDDVLRAKTLFYRWIAGMFPPQAFRPSLDFAQLGASIMLENLKEADLKDMHVWVGHENWIAAFLMHWLGEWTFDWVNFLDGFILQFYEDHMVTFFREKKMNLNYPYWWQAR
jgi:broad specificity phosphatase PhoE